MISIRDGFCIVMEGNHMKKKLLGIAAFCAVFMLFRVNAYADISVYTEVDFQSARSTDPDNPTVYVLRNDVTCNSSLYVGENEYVEICLNDYTLTACFNGGPVVVNGTLTLRGSGTLSCTAVDVYNKISVGSNG